MSFTIIKGVFNPSTGVPDGDSVRFLPYDDSLFNRIEGSVDFKSEGEVQLRYEGIDALEKAAIEPFSSDATAKNKQLLGGSQNGRPGYILSKQTDRYGRPVCFVFAGDTTETDGSAITLESDLLRQSVNYQLLAAGIVYPLFYETLYKELRDEMVVAVKNARTGDLGVWKEDKTNAGFIITPPVDLANLPPIFPKLWRRLGTFYSRRSNRNKTALEFAESLAQGNDRLFTIPDQRWVKFSTILKVDGNKIKLLYKPEEMIFRGEG